MSMRTLLIFSILLSHLFCAAASAAPGRQQTTSHVVASERPITMAQLQALKPGGVSVAEVSDYVYGGYSGALQSPPHADINPRKAFVIFWKDFNYRFVFSHEASYCP